MRIKGFPTTEPCEHGAGAGAICEKCAGGANFQLRLVASVTEAVEKLAAEDADVNTLTAAVRVRDAVLHWATDRELCSKEIGPCACFRCVGDGDPEPEPRRCPHDGGFCHHDCAEGECFREAGGMSLSTPHPGYPLPGHGEVPR